MNTKDLNTHFKYRFLALLILLGLGVAYFILWAFFFYVVFAEMLLGVMHLFGFIFLIAAILGGTFIYLLVLGSVLRSWGELKKTVSFRTAFFKITCLYGLSIFLSLAIAGFVSEKILSIDIKVMNLSDKEVESVLITYPEDQSHKISKLAAGEMKNVNIIPGEGSVMAKVTYADGTVKEKVFEEFFSPLMTVKPRARLEIRNTSIEVIDQ